MRKEIQFTKQNRYSTAQYKQPEENHLPPSTVSRLLEVSFVLIKQAPSCWEVNGAQPSLSRLQSPMLWQLLIMVSSQVYYYCYIFGWFCSHITYFFTMMCPSCLMFIGYTHICPDCKLIEHQSSVLNTFQYSKSLAWGLANNRGSINTWKWLMKCHDKCMTVPTVVQHALAQEATEGSIMVVPNRHQERFHKIPRPGSTPGLLNEHLRVQGPQEILSYTSG